MLKRLKYRFNIFKDVFPYSEGVKKYFALDIVMQVILLATVVILPFFYSIFIEKVILGKMLKLMWFVAGGYLTIQIVNMIATRIRYSCNKKITNELIYRMRINVIDDLFRRNFSEYEAMNIGDMRMVLDDDISKISLFTYQASEYFIQILQIVILGVSLVLIEWKLALFAFIVIPLTFFLDYRCSQYERGPKKELRNNDKEWGTWLYKTVSGWREIRALNLEKSEERKFMKYTHNDALLFTKWNNFWIIRTLIIPKLKDEFFMQFMLYFLGGLMIGFGHLTIGVLLVFTQYYAKLSDAVKAVSLSEADMQMNHAYFDRVTTELEKVNKSNDREEKRKDFTHSEIIMKHVDFRYPLGEREVLKDFSLTIKPGERVAIVGESGSGKSTILKLITGMLSADSGEISYSGINYNDIDKEELYKDIGLILQDSFLFNDTIRQNLLYGNENATEEELCEACKKAYIDDFIENLPEKYDTFIGERGLRLSGGQRQRIVLARLFLRDVKVFIFDEATSALDQYSENIIQNAISEISANKTIIVVAHRQSSIEVCDRVVRI